MTDEEVFLSDANLFRDLLEGPLERLQKLNLDAMRIVRDLLAGTPKPVLEYRIESTLLESETSLDENVSVPKKEDFPSLGKLMNVLAQGRYNAAIGLVGALVGEFSAAGRVKVKEEAEKLRQEKNAPDQASGKIHDRGQQTSEGEPSLAG